MKDDKPTQVQLELIEKLCRETDSFSVKPRTIGEAVEIIKRLKRKQGIKHPWRVKS